jgi:arylsulfatase A
MGVGKYFSVAFSLLCALAQAETVVIDILPADTENFVDTTSSSKLLQVGLLTTSLVQGDTTEFDATRINPDTVSFGVGMATPDSNYLPMAVQDLDGDGDDDLNLVFSIPATGIACEETSAALTGLTYVGELVNGSDVITTPDCPRCHGEPGNYRSNESEYYSVPEDTELNVVAPVTNAPVTMDVPPENGALTLAPDGSFSYLPKDNYFGLDSFSYSDPGGAISSVNISVSSVNDRPVAVVDTISVASGINLQRPAPGLLGNDQDVDGDDLQALLETDASNGTLMLSADGSYSYAPGPDFTGSDSFSYFVSDGIANSDPVTVDISLPNVVFILVDDMGQGDSMLYNPGSAISLPNLSALAGAGIQFDNAHAPTAACSPSRYSILTGNYPYRGRKPNGVWKTLDQQTMIIPGQMTLGHVMQAANYNTAFIGKLHNGGAFWNLAGTAYTGVFGDIDLSRSFDRGPTQFGFDYSFLMPGGLGKGPYAYFENDRIVRYDNVSGDYQPFYTAAEAHAAMIYVNHYQELNGGTVGPASYAMDNYDSRKAGSILTNRAMAFIDRHVSENMLQGSKRPFFLYLALPEPHSPWTPPPVFNPSNPEEISLGSTGTPILNATPISERTDMVFEGDVILGTILAKLDDQGLLNDTLIIFTSDNGVNSQLTQAGYAGIGERIETGPEGIQHINAQGAQAGVPLRGYKLQIYEGGHKAPLVMRWGDGTSEGSVLMPGRNISQLISSQDMIATLAQAIGVFLPADQVNDSFSYWPILATQDLSVIRPHLLVHGQPVTRSIDLFGSADQFGQAFYKQDLAGDLWKLIVDANIFDRLNNQEYIALYNLTIDPGETNNRLNDTDVESQVDWMIAEYMNVIALDRTRN